MADTDLKKVLERVRNEPAAPLQTVPAAPPLAPEPVGECYKIKIRNLAGNVVETWPVPSSWVWPVAGIERLVDHYEIRPSFSGAGILVFAPEDVIAPTEAKSADVKTPDAPRGGFF